MTFLIDLFRSKPISKKFSDILKNVKSILVVDEQTQWKFNFSCAV